MPDTKYYLWAQFFVYIKNYLSTIKNSVTRDEKIITILKAFDYWKNKKQTNVFGEDITTYRTKIFIIDMWILFKCYIKAWIVVYVFRIKPPIEKMNSDSENKIATTPIKNKNHFIVYKNIDQIKVPFSDNTPTIIDTPMHIV